MSSFFNQGRVQESFNEAPWRSRSSCAAAALGTNQAELKFNVQHPQRRNNNLRSQCCPPFGKMESKQISNFPNPSIIPRTKDPKKRCKYVDSFHAPPRTRTGNPSMFANYSVSFPKA